MDTTTIRVSYETKTKIKAFSSKYNKVSVDLMLDYILNYIERNEIDLNLDLNNGTYNTIKEFDQKINILDQSISNLEQHFEKELNKKAKRVEHLISIVMNIEKDYFFPLKEQGILKVAIQREMKEDLIYKNVLQDVIKKIVPVYSEKRKKDVYIFDVDEPEFKRLLNYAR